MTRQSNIINIKDVYQRGEKMTDHTLVLKNQIIEAANLAYENKLVLGTSGNFSAKIPDSNKILMTPTNLAYDKMKPEDIVTIDTYGKIIEGERKPSFETPVHCAVYRAYPEVSAVIHTEPQYVISFSVVGQEVPVVTHDLAIHLGSSDKPVPLCPYLPTGSEEFANAMIKVMKKIPAVVWPHHGLLTAAKSIMEAYVLSLVIEKNAKVFFCANQVGEPKKFPNSMIPNALKNT